MSTSPRPPYDPELKTVMDQAFADGMPLHFDIDDLPAMREGASFGASAEPTLALSPGSTHEERTIAGPKGDIQVSILRPSSFDSTKQHSAILFYHPGGMIMAPIPFEDAYAVLKWIGASLVELSIDPARLLLAGTSGGGAICAGVTLLGRERGGPKVCGQLLIAPMLDDRRGSISARQFEDEGGHWSSRSNRFVWRCVLGSRSGTPDVKDFEAPGRATDLSGLPPTYLEVGSAEVCRDEVVAFASKLWESGVQAELHVWPGGWHNFAAHAPDAEVSKKALRTRHQWVEKHLKEVC